MATNTARLNVEASAAVTAAPEYEFDVFVSYCDQDEEWAVAELISPLQQAGLKVIHKLDFEMGAYKVEARARAVEHSRRSIIVVTPAWCASQWESFDALVAQTQDPGGVFRRVIPLILEPCNLPKQLAALVPAKFTNVSVRREAFARLLKGLGRSAQEVNEATTKSFKKGIAALAELVRIPTVQVSLGIYQKSIADALERIGVLGRYKRLHDYFQRADGAHKLLLQSRKMLAAGAETWDGLEDVVGELVTELELLLDYARQGSFPPDEILWTSRIERISGELKPAVWTQDDGKLAGISERLLKVLAGQPMRINDKLVHIAGQLALGAVADELRKIRSAMVAVPFDEEAQARLEEFTSGIESLDKLDRSLRILISNHSCLQEIDDSLRSFELTPHPSPAEIADVWIDLHAPLRTLNGEDGALWLTAMRELAQKIDTRVEPVPTDSRVVRELQSSFRDFRDKIYRAFNQTDEDLRRFCDQLQKVGDTLSAAIGRMQHVGASQS